MKLKLILLILLLSILISNCGIIETQEKITSKDFPTKLSEQVDTIEVSYIEWACACANWLPTNYLDDPNYDASINSANCIFIEAEKEELKIPDEYPLGRTENRLQLIGRYYLDKGISRDYKQPIPQKPDYAKVFRYSKAEVILK